jgi:hypothetical protein
MEEKKSTFLGKVESWDWDLVFANSILCNCGSEQSRMSASSELRKETYTYIEDKRNLPYQRL